MNAFDPSAGINIGGAMQAGMESRNAMLEMQRQKDAQAFMQQNGAAIMAGDKNAMGQMFGYDPKLASGLMVDQSGMANDSRRTDIAERSANAGIANDAARLKLAQEEGKRQMAEYAAGAEARDLEQSTARLAKLHQDLMMARGNQPLLDELNKANPDLPDVADASLDEEIARISGALGMGDDATEAFRTQHQKLLAAGFGPDTPEYKDTMLKGPIERTEDVTKVWRPATPEEARDRGATAGQINDQTGDFKPAQGKDAPTGDERKGGGMYDRMVAAETTLDRLAADEGAENLSLVERGLTGMGAPEGYALSGSSQRVLQAQRDWVRAKLRLESGAVIGDEEMAEEIRTYFPQPGEEKATRDQKKQARRQAMEQVKTQAGRAVPASPGAAGDVPPAAIEAGIDPAVWPLLSPEEQAVWMN
jgi:hypothetical protein